MFWTAQNTVIFLPISSTYRLSDRRGALESGKIRCWWEGKRKKWGKESETIISSISHKYRTVHCLASKIQRVAGCVWAQRILYCFIFGTRLVKFRSLWSVGNYYRYARSSHPRVRARTSTLAPPYISFRILFTYPRWSSIGRHKFNGLIILLYAAIRAPHTTLPSHRYLSARGPVSGWKLS